MKTNLSLTVTALLVILMVSCRKDHHVVYHQPGQQVITIGAMLALTGTGYSSGVASRAALELAVMDINESLQKSGNQWSISLVIADTETDTAKALEVISEFYRQGIRVVIGPYSSAELQAVRDFADLYGMLVISPSSVAVSLAIPGDNIYRFVPTDVIQGKAMTAMLVSDKVKIIVPVMRDDLWGRDLVNATGKEFIAQGGVVAQPVKYQPQGGDLQMALSQLDQQVGALSANYSYNEIAIYMISFAEGATLLSGAKKFSHLNSVFWYGSSAFAENSAALSDSGAALFAFTHGLPCPVYGLDDGAKHGWEPLQKRIVSAIGRQPDVYAYTAYDALWVASRTLLKCDKGAPVLSIRAPFEHEAWQYFGVSGNTRLDTNGDRAEGNYDFWSVKRDSTGFVWKRTARYQSSDGNLIRFKP